MHRTPGLYTEPVPVATGHYIGVLAHENTALRDKVNEVLRARMRDGTLERIYRKWNIWDQYQPAFFKASADLQAASGEPSSANSQRPTANNVVLAYIPALLKASVITIVLSCLSMALAIFAGVFIASGR